MSYSPHTWVTGETVTAAKLNNMESGIADNDAAITNLQEGESDLQGAVEDLQDDIAELNEQMQNLGLSTINGELNITYFE